MWAASGHLTNFVDPLRQCLGECKKRWREDHLREAVEAEVDAPREQRVVRRVKDERQQPVVKGRLRIDDRKERPRDGSPGNQLRVAQVDRLIAENRQRQN